MRVHLLIYELWNAVVSILAAPTLIRHKSSMHSRIILCLLLKRDQVLQLVHLGLILALDGLTPLYEQINDFGIIKN